MKVTKFAFSLFGINTYVVWDPATRCCAIVDPGMIVQEEENALVRYIEREKLKVTHIINTHLHVDHAIGNDFAVKQFAVPVVGHKEDAELGEMLPQQAVIFQIPIKVRPVTLSEYLDEGDVVEIGDGRLEVLHVPGHSPGSIALYDREEGFVIAGDALFSGSIGRTDLYGGDMDQLVRNIKNKLMTLPDDTIVYSGHGPETTIGRERATNPFLR